MTPAPIPIRRQLFLLGFMGCGKTTVGQLLAERLGWKFIDVDDELERRQGRTIKRIFEEQGEPHFRRIEREFLEEILAGGEQEPAVVALGGGTFAQPANVELIRARGGLTFWLVCPLDELRRRCRGMTNRPLFRDAASFEELYRQRLPYYQQADFQVDADQPDPHRVVEGILQCGLI